MPEQKIVFQNFARGEWGLQSPYNVGFGLYRGHLLYQGWFSGHNAMRYTNGMVGPRYEPVGTTFNTPSGTNGPAYMVGGLDTIGQPYAVVIVWESGAPCQVFTGLLTGSGTIPQVWHGAGNMGNGAVGDMFTGFAPGGPDVYISHASGTVADAIYQVHLDTGTLVGLTGSPGAMAICQYQSFLMAGGTLNGKGNQLWYSAPGNFAAWPALNFINIGTPTGVITGLFAVRNMLIVTKTDGTYWALTGTPGVNEVVRQIETAAPLAANTGAVLAGSSVAGNVSVRTGFRNVAASAHTSGIMAQFDGRRMVPMRWAQLPDDTNGPLPAKAVPLHDDGDWAMGCDLSGVLRCRRGATWTTHDFSAVQPAFTSWLPQPDGRILMMNSTATTVYTWDPYSERPPVAGDVNSGVPTPAPSSVSFQLPEWWERTGVDVAVRYVLLDFTKWNTGTGTPNTLTLTLNVLRPPGVISNSNPTPGAVTGGIPRGDMTQTFRFSEDSTVPGAVGSSQQQRVNVLFDEIQGNGFQIGFTNLAGVAIEKLVVGVDTFTVRGR